MVTQNQVYYFIPLGGGGALFPQFNTNFHNEADRCLFRCLKLSAHIVMPFEMARYNFLFDHNVMQKCAL